MCIQARSIPEAYLFRLALGVQETCMMPDLRKLHRLVPCKCPISPPRFKQQHSGFPSPRHLHTLYDLILSHLLITTGKRKWFEGFNRQAHPGLVPNIELHRSFRSRLIYWIPALAIFDESPTSTSSNQPGLGSVCLRYL